MKKIFEFLWKVRVVALQVVLLSSGIFIAMYLKSFVQIVIFFLIHIIITAFCMGNAFKQGVKMVFQDLSKVLHAEDLSALREEIKKEFGDEN